MTETHKKAPTVSYEKSKAAMRAFLHGKGFFKALKAMDISERYHTGTRKDGAPEFSHQIAQAHILMALLPHLIDPEGTMIVLFLHDTVEDYGTPEDAAPLPPFTLKDVLDLFGPEISRSVDTVSKVVNGYKKSMPQYFDEMAQDPRASIVKGTDRFHNHQSMPGAFSAAKQDSYLEETEEHILPMMKVARRAFPEQHAAYELLKIMLHSQMGLIRAMQPTPVSEPETAQMGM